MADNLVIAGGKVYFDRMSSGVKIGERYFGLSEECSIGSATTKVPQYSNENGLSEKVDETTIKIDRTFKIRLKNIDAENLALNLMGASSTITQTSGAVTAEALGAVKKGFYYQFGVSTSRPAGIRKVSAVTLKKGGTSLVLGTDYTVDLDLARAYILTTSVTVVDGDSLTVDYTKTATTWEEIISSGLQAQGALRIIAANAKGTNRDWYFPLVNVSPSGDLGIKGNPENPAYSMIDLEVEVLTRDSSTSAVYCDGRAV